MANFNRKYGSNTPLTRTDNNDTPQQRKFEAKTGKDADSATGDIPHQTPKTDSKVNKGLWAEAEHAALNQTGGFSGATKEGRKIAIQEKYDQMVENDKELRKWAGDGGILGDIG